MVNPYDAPVSIKAADPQTPIVPSWALVAFGAFPVAIAVTYASEHFLFPTVLWNIDDWFWTFGPPSYLFSVWMFSLFIHKRPSRKLMALLAVSMIPLLLYALRTLSTAAELYFFLTAGLEGFGINRIYGLTAIGLPLWLCASLAYTTYFCCVALRFMRPTSFRVVDRSID